MAMVYPGARGFTPISCGFHLVHEGAPRLSGRGAGPAMPSPNAGWPDAQSGGLCRRGYELLVPRFTSPCALECKESFHQNFPSSEAAKNIIKVFLLIFPPTFYPQNRMYYNCESIQIITIIHIKFNSELSYSK